ncbi:hypothetical protein [Chitinimonas sp.]|uniref:hypothetical protein n=1 Tax=Chitinimonas sp. TaxID=1934313 RepID=UPI0035B0FDD4
MSTKVTIKHFGESDGGGFHLYEEAFDPEGAFIHLEFEGVEFEVRSASGKSPSHVSVRLPRAWAEKLGIVSASS